MTTMLPLNATSLLPVAPSLNMASTAASGQAAWNDAAPGPSAVVTIGQAGAIAADRTYSAQGKLSMPAATVAWSSDTSDMVSRAMATNYTSQSVSGRLYMLGSALLDRYTTTGSDFSQSVHVTSPGTIGASSNGAQANIQLTVKTASGVQVDVTLYSTQDDLAVSVTSDGELTDAERSALAKMSDAFQGAINGLSAKPPTLDLSGLTQFDPSVLSSVDLQSSVTGTDQQIQSIKFHADSTARSLSASGPAGTMKVDVDMRNSALWGSDAQRAEAIDAYLKQLDSANVRGHGDASLMATFKDAFVEMNSNYGNSSQRLPGTAGARWLDQAGHAMLTGLADFSASIATTPESTNPMRLSETDSFSYQLSQKTTTSGNKLTGTISQQQQSHLNASYHKPLAGNGPLMLSRLPSSQDYDYVQIDDSADSTTRIATENGKLLQATLSESAHQSTRQLEYVGGRLLSDVTTPSDTSRSQDLLALLQPFINDGQAGKNTGDWQRTLSTLHRSVLGLHS